MVGDGNKSGWLVPLCVVQFFLGGRGTSPSEGPWWSFKTMGGWRHASCFAVGSQETRDWDRNWDRMEIPCVFCPQVKYTSNQQPHVGLQHASTITPPSHLRHCACAGPVASLLASPSGSDSGCVVAFISPGGAAWARTGRASSSCGRGRGAGRNGVAKWGPDGPVDAPRHRVEAVV